MLYNYYTDIYIKFILYLIYIICYISCKRLPHVVTLQPKI